MSDIVSRVANVLVRNESTDCLRDALAMLRQDSAAESAFAFVSTGPRTLRLVSSVSSHAIDEKTIVALDRTPIDEGWFPPELGEPSDSLAVAIHSDEVVRSVVVLSFTSRAPRPNVEVLRAAATLVCLAIVERHARPERRLFELALQESQERIVRILESITDAFYSVDHEWRVVYANARARQLFEEVGGFEDGMTIWDIFPPAIGTEFEAAYRRALETRVPEHFEELYAPLARWYEVHAYPSDDGLSVYFRDVTSRRRVEEELREREERFALVAQATDETMWDWDLQTGHAWRSSAIETVFRFHRSEVRADIDWWFERIHPDDLDRVRSSMQEAIAAGERFWSAEYRILAGDGRWAYVLDRGSILRDDKGTPVRMIGARMDITQRKEAERELETSREESRELARRLIFIQEEERRSIARDIHDILGQALTAMKIDAISLANNPRVTGAARSRANRIAGIVDDTIRDVRHMSARLRPIVLDDLGLLPAITSEVRAFKDRTGITCTLVNHVVDLTLDGDVSTAIFRIVQEALTNVARHSGARNAHVEIKREPDGLRIEVRDDGCGIVATRDGSSLGLVGMKERALLIGAELSVTGGAAGGTVVALRIPA